MTWPGSWEDSRAGKFEGLVDLTLSLRIHNAPSTAFLVSSFVGAKESRTLSISLSRSCFLRSGSKARLQIAREACSERGMDMRMEARRGGGKEQEKV